MLIQSLPVEKAKILYHENKKNPSLKAREGSIKTDILCGKQR
jgi:hypothetical protein